jgi:hypothetical protein
MTSATNSSNQEATAALTLTNEMPIERKKRAGIAKLLKKWYLASPGSSSSPVSIGPATMYHHTTASNSRAIPKEAA